MEILSEKFAELGKAHPNLARGIRFILGKHLGTQLLGPIDKSDPPVIIDEGLTYKKPNNAVLKRIHADEILPFSMQRSLFANVLAERGINNNGETQKRHKRAMEILHIGHAINIAAHTRLITEEGDNLKDEYLHNALELAIEDNNVQGSISVSINRDKKTMRLQGEDGEHFKSIVVHPDLVHIRRIEGTVAIPFITAQEGTVHAQAIEDYYSLYHGITTADLLKEIQ